MARPESMEEFDVELVRNRRGIERLAANLFGEPHTPSVILTAHSENRKPVLPLPEVRAITGPYAQIFLVASYLLDDLYDPLGRRLAVPRGMARIFWPELTLQSELLHHPLVPILDIESVESALAEFARQFDLSRPHIRREVEQLDELNAQLKRQNALLRAEISRLKREARLDG